MANVKSKLMEARVREPDLVNDPRALLSAPAAGTSPKVKTMNTMTNDMTELLLAICRKACTHEGDGHLSAREYLKQYSRLIKETGRLLEHLGLAELDDQSELGWKPTARLISIIAKQAMRPLSNSKTDETQRDALLLESVIYLAHLNPDDLPAVHYGFKVLAVFGLLRSSVDDTAWKPTRLLRQLVVEAHCNRHPR